MVNKLLEKRWPVARQLLKEFWIQMILSLAWASYKAYRADTENFVVAVGAFSASFFFLSWLLGQVLRVKKQQKVESDLHKLKDDLQIVLTSLEVQINNLAGFTMGYGSKLSFDITKLEDDSFGMFIKNTSDYPVFDVKLMGIFLSGKMVSIGKNTGDALLFRPIPALYPKDSHFKLFNFKNDNLNRYIIEITFFTRDGYYQIEIVSIKDHKQFAARIEHNETLEYFIPSGFPDYISGMEEQLFKNAKNQNG